MEIFNISVAWDVYWCDTGIASIFYDVRISLLDLYHDSPYVAYESQKYVFLTRLLRELFVAALTMYQLNTSHRGRPTSVVTTETNAKVKIYNVFTYSFCGSRVLLRRGSHTLRNISNMS